MKSVLISWNSDRVWVTIDGKPVADVISGAISYNNGRIVGSVTQGKEIRFESESEPVAEPVEEPTEPPKPKDGRKNKIDTGKVLALHNAGWRNDAIAVEMGCSEGSVSMIISKAKKEAKS